MRWYRACVSAPDTPPAPFLSEDDATPASAQIAAHRTLPAAAVFPDDAAAAAAGDLEPRRSRRSPADDARGCSESSRDGEPAAAGAAAGRPPGEDVSIGDQASRGSEAAAPAAAAAADPDVWLLPRKPSAQSVPAKGGNASAGCRPEMSPRTPEVLRESVAARAEPAAERGSQLSRPGGGAAADEPRSEATVVSESSPPQQSAQPAAAENAEEVEQLDSAQKLTEQAARVQRRARRLVSGRTRQKVRAHDVVLAAFACLSGLKPTQSRTRSDRAVNG